MCACFVLCSWGLRIQKTTVDRLMECFADLNCMNVCGVGKPAESGMDLQDSGMNVFKKRKGGLPVA